METRVVHVPERQRYEIYLGDELVGHATARVEGDATVFPHVEVAPRFRGQNYANLLVRGALDDVRKKGGRIVARCPFVVAFLRRYPSYRELEK